MIPYSSDHSKSSASPDRRYRMSQPTLNSSFTGINFEGSIKGSKFSYNSLRTSGDVSISYQIKEDRLSTPNVHCYIEGTGGNASRRLSGHHASPSRFLFGPTGKRERLSQPTLVTGDYYPGKIHHQRLSYPCLHTWNERPTSLHSPIKQKRMSTSKVKCTQRDRLSVLDFGSKYRATKDTKVRDRFSIPELESQNELKLIAGTPKQRYSLDSQLNPDGTRARRLLPIASSPISENQSIPPSDGLEGVIIASATPLLPSSERKTLVPKFQSKLVAATPPTPVKSMRERMSVPEIRNSSLRRLLDPPIRQRHSFSTFRQSLKSIEKSPDGPDVKSEESQATEEAEDKRDKTERTKSISVEPVPEADEASESKNMPKHIQKYYSFTSDCKEEVREHIGKLSTGKPKKKYLESNFDENEQVITTVIETEIPFILSSPKYMKKTHVYSSEPPKWMQKCLDEERKMEETVRINQKNKLSPGKKKSPLATSPGKKKKVESKEEMEAREKAQAKDTTIRIKSSRKLGENKYEVAVSSNISETEICRLYGIECDTDSEDSTSV